MEGKLDYTVWACGTRGGGSGPFRIVITPKIVLTSEARDLLFLFQQQIPRAQKQGAPARIIHHGDTEDTELWFRKNLLRDLRASVVGFHLPSAA